MMHRLILPLCLTLLPHAVLGDETPLTGAQFGAYATGKTLTFSQGGNTYGTEQYLPGNRVLWAFEGDICRKGRWYAEADLICFVYDHDPSPQCWTFWQSDNGLNARFEGDAPGTELSEVARSPRPLQCAGPDVGA
jgi:hypothetical protein